MQLPSNWKSYVLLGAGVALILAAPWAWRHRPRRRPKGLPKPVKEDTYQLWPRYHRVVRKVFGRRNSFRKALTLRSRGDRPKRQARAEWLVSKVCSYIGQPKLTAEQKQHVVAALLMAADARAVLFYWWHRCHKESPRVRRETIPGYLRRYAEQFSEVSEWAEQEVKTHGPCSNLLEALIAECDRMVSDRLKRLAKSAKTTRMLPFWDPKAALWDQPEGMGDYLREIVLLYAIWTRPDKQVETDLKTLGKHFGIPFTKLDAACALARAGKTYPARRMFQAAVPSRPKRAKDFAMYTRVALCFGGGAGPDMRSATRVLDRMVEQAPASAKAQARLYAGRCYADMGNAAHAVQQFRQARKQAPEGETGFDAALRAAELEAFKLNAAEAAAEQLERLVAAAPDDERRAAAQRLLLRVYGRLDRKEDLSRLADTIVAAQPATPEGAQQVLETAAELYRAGANKQAEHLLTSRLDALNQAGKSSQARLLLGLVDLARWQNDAAREQFRQVIRDASDADTAARAWFLMGYSHLVSQEYLDAKEAFDMLCIKHPDSRWAKMAKKQYLPGLRKFSAQAAPAAP